jgi:hypothetical protein
MRKLLLAALFALSWGAVASVPVAAAESHVPGCIDPVTGAPVLNCTFTQNVQGATQTFPTSLPCVDPPTSPPTGTLTITFNAVFHVTVNGAGDAWITSTSTGNFSFVPFDPSRPSFTGHFTGWFGGSFNQNNLVVHDIFNVHGTGSDGSSLAFHIIDHMSISASGVTLTFTKAAC